MIWKLRLAFLLVVMLPEAVAQTSSSPNVRSQPTHAIPSVTSLKVLPFDNVPFRYSNGNLPAGFRGADVKKLFEIIDHSPVLADKSEFESTAAYQSRIASFPASSVLPGLTAQDTIALVASQSKDEISSDALEVVYDADSAAFDLRLTFQDRPRYLLPGGPEMSRLDLIKNLRESGDYVGSNAMGAKVAVHKSSIDSYGIIVDPSSWIFPESGEDNLSRSIVSLKVKVDPSVAPSLKPQLQIAIVGTLHAPWIVRDVLSHDPTISDPYELLDAEQYLAFAPTELLVFRKDTGEVLRRLDTDTFEASQALAVNLRLSCRSLAVLDVTIDGQAKTVVCRDRELFRANHTVVIQVNSERDIDNLTFVLNNGQPIPNWVRQVDRFGSASLFRSATLTVNAP